MRVLFAFAAAATLAFGPLALTPDGFAAEQEDWKIIHEDAYRNRFAYDRASVKKTPAGTTTVMAEVTGAKYLYEIDCKNGKLRLLEGPGAAPEQWFGPVSGSGDQLLFDRICK